MINLIVYHVTLVLLLSLEATAYPVVLARSLQPQIQVSAIHVHQALYLPEHLIVQIARLVMSQTTKERDVLLVIPDNLAMEHNVPIVPSIQMVEMMVRNVMRVQPDLSHFQDKIVILVRLAKSLISYLQI